MANIQFTPDEIIANLRDIHIPTVLVEGKYDFTTYQKLQEKIGILEVNFMPCGGRTALLKIYKRRHEFPNKKVLFIADKDLWVFTGVPTEYKEVFFTLGYSIENDLYHDGRARLEELLDQKELEKRNEIVKSVCDWFAFEVELWKKNSAYDNKFSDVTILNDSFLPTNETNWSTSFLTKRNYEKAPQATLDELQTNYSLKLRGKYIFQIYDKIFKERKGKGVVRYQQKQLADMCLRVGIADNETDTSMNRIIAYVKTSLQIA